VWKRGAKFTNLAIRDSLSRNSAIIDSSALSPCARVRHDGPFWIELADSGWDSPH
jgi:hypothetical protein